MDHNKEFTSCFQLWKQKCKGVEKKLVGFEILDNGIAQPNFIIFDREGNDIGIVTSYAQSSFLKRGIGMGYLQTEFSKPGTEIFINSPVKKISALVKNTPFVNF